MIPVTAVGQAAGAVGGIADSGLVVGLTRGRLWIGLLAVLLGGIVALNVWGLSLSAGSSGTAAKLDELERENSVLRARIDRRLSNEKVMREARELGLGAPSPKAIRTVRAGEGDAATAADRLRGGELAVLTTLPIAPELDPEAAIDPVATDPAATDPAVGAEAATVPVDPAGEVAATGEVAPESTDPATVAPAAAAPQPTEPAASGGVPIG